MRAARCGLQLLKGRSDVGGTARQCRSGMGLSASSKSSRVPVGPEVGESADVRVPHGSETKRKRRGARLCFGWARVGPRASALGLLPTGERENRGVGPRKQRGDSEAELGSRGRKRRKMGRSGPTGKKEELGLGPDREKREFSIFQIFFHFVSKFKSKCIPNQIRI